MLVFRLTEKLKRNLSDSDSSISVIDCYHFYTKITCTLAGGLTIFKIDLVLLERMICRETLSFPPFVYRNILF